MSAAVATANTAASAFSQVSRAFSLRLVTAVLAFVTSAVVSRTLGPEGRGEYYAPLLIASTLIAIWNLGLDQANVYLFGTRGIPPRRLVSQAGFVATGGGIVGSGLVLLGPWAAPAFFSDISPVMLWLTAISIPIGIHTIYATGLLTLTGRVLAPLVTAASSAAVLLVCVVILAGLGALTPANAFLCAVAANVGVWFTQARLLASPGAWIRSDFGLLRESLAQSLVLHLGTAALFLHLRVDMFLIKGILGTSALGLYSLAVVLAETLMLITDALALVLLPRQMSGSIQSAAQRALLAARLTVVLGVVAAIGWGLCGHAFIVTVFGRDFAACFVTLLVLIPGITALGMQRMCGAVVLRVGTPWRITAIHAFSAVLNFSLNLWWIPRLGTVGAALASTISYVLGAVAFLYWTSILGQEGFSSSWRVRKNDLMFAARPIVDYWFSRRGASPANHT